MSIIAIVLDGDRFAIGSDGCAYDPDDGTILAFVSKVMPFPEFDCFIANTGAGKFALNVRGFMPDGVADFDDVLDVIADVVRDVDASYLDQEYPFDARATVLLGGWSTARERMEFYKIHTRPRQTLNTATGETSISPPFELLPVENGQYLSNYPGPELIDRFGLDQPLSAEEWVVRAVLANRMSLSAEAFTSGQHYAVGGFLHLTVVQRGFSSQRVLHRWPDTIGERIDPTKDGLDVDPQ